MKRAFFLFASLYLLAVCQSRGQDPYGLINVQAHEATRILDRAYGDSILAAARAQDTTRLKVLISEVSGGTIDSTLLMTQTMRAADTNRAIVREGLKQPLDADLTAIAAMSATGTVRRTGADTWTATASDTAGLGTALAAKAPTASPVFTGFMTGSTSMRGVATFSTTSVRVAVYIPGAASTDYFILTPTGSSVVTTTNLTALAKTDSLIIFRGSSGTSGAKINWILMR
jgi:hypothetical protein